MVAKISTGGNMFGALAYNQNKVDSGEAKVLFSNRMLLSEDGNFSIGECMRSFEMQMPVQLSTKKPILHISINPHPEDVLTDRQLSLSFPSKGALPQLPFRQAIPSLQPLSMREEASSVK